MMVFSDRALKAAGLDFHMARAMLAPAEDELLVHIVQCLDGPTVPQASRADLDGVTHRAGSHRDPSLGILEKPTDQRSAVYTPTAEVDQVVDGQLDVLPEHEVHRADVVPPAVNPLGPPRLPERGFTLADVRRVAAALHVQVQYDLVGHVMLTGTHGCRVYATLAEAADALNRRSFT
jgi:hypothetical protein